MYVCICIFCICADSKTKTNHLDSALSSGQTFGADAETLSDKGRKSRQLSSRYISGIDVETVDRGVGPTPFSEPQVSVFGSTSVDFPANGTPSGFMISPFIDPRNGFVDPVYGAYNNWNQSITNSPIYVFIACNQMVASYENIHIGIVVMTNLE